MEKKIAIAFLKWTKKNCTARTTSRNNIYAEYWLLNSTGVLYSAEDLFDYWIENVKK